MIERTFGDISEVTYAYDPDAADLEPMLKEGATPGWLVVRGLDGPDRVARCVALTDPEGQGFIDVDNDSWQDATVTEG